MALPRITQQMMYNSVVAISAQLEALGLSIVDQYDSGNLDGRTASTTHDLLLEGMANLSELKTAIESGFEPGPESKELDGVLVVFKPGEEMQVYRDHQDLARLYNDAPTAQEPERLPLIRDDELPDWDDITYDVPNN